jgi:hypothetical protein
VIRYFVFWVSCSGSVGHFVSWKSRVLGFGHAELDIGDADIAEIARLYRGHILVL